MDNKRFYKKISTMFWFLLATLPVWFSVLYSLAYFLIHTDSLSLTDIQTFVSDNNYSVNLYNVCNDLRSFIPSFLRDAFFNLFSSFNLTVYATSWIVIFPAWFCWVYFLELMVDFIAILPKIFHRLLERVCDYL